MGPPIVQNNNKGDNVKIVEPLSGKTFTMLQLAKIHKVNVQTLYKRRTALWSDLELLVGKKLPHLHAMSVALHELPPPPPVGKKKVLQPFKMPSYVPPGDWEPIEDDWQHYLDTGIERNTHAMRHREEYDAVAAWVSTVTAGLPVPPWPQLKYLKMNPPAAERLSRLYTPKPKATPKPAYTYYGGYDPADCMPDPEDECDPDD